MYQALETYHDRLRNQPSEEAFLESLWSELRRIGVQDFNLGILLNDDSKTPGKCLKFRSWHSPWDDFYLEQNYQSQDYLVDYARYNTAPIFWDDPVFDPLMSDIQERIIRESTQFGIYGGRTYPLVETATAQGGLFNIVQRSPFDSSFKSWVGRDEELHSLLTFALLALSEFHAVKPHPEASDLTTEEKTSLERLLGKQPMTELNLSRLYSARRKLSAKSNHEAVLQAYRLGMITP
ncbi:autoinducer binding domain-containing protein [Aestuariispira insulae]|uniref:Autoinducer binding domain-containing protein n=1 Tax=Aestuariispira insulae TaxID=1461337 RepID=A0A3D9HHW6_9PROT|nr:autoinducer binding domain-containing protein [Aestuariispira insulae]RED49109.1 autoinducer binding domain-containing protein [Aestuariispira insulae]